MKLKLRFDKDSLKAFFLGNVEKIIFGAIVIGCGVIIFAGGKVFKDPLKTPKALQDLAKKAEDNVLATLPRNNDDFRACKVIDYTAIAGRSEDRVEEKSYPQPRPWLPLLFEPKIKREQPKVFTVQNLRAVVGRGPLNRQSATGGGVRGFRWVVVTGAIPVKKQLDEYVRVFEPAVQYEAKADVPKYAGYVIERAEIGSAQELEWKEIDVKAAKNRAANLGPPQTDTLEAKYTSSIMTFPLLPLVGRYWGAETQHEDITGPSFDAVQKDPGAYKDRKVTWLGDSVSLVLTDREREEGRPLAAFTAKLADPAKPREQRVFAVLFASKEAMENFKSSGAIKGKVAGRETLKLSGGREGAGGVTATVPLLIHEAPPRSDDRDESEPDLGEPNRGGRAPRPDGTGLGADRNEIVDYQLFRFFDLNVEPGKHYRYRVKLILENPNYLEQPRAKVTRTETTSTTADMRRKDPLLQRSLKDPVTGSSATLETAATPPTEAVTVPEDLRLLALSVAPAKPFGRTGVSDPAGMSGKMAVVQWLPATGREARHEFESLRGTLANFSGVKPPVRPGAAAADQPTGRADFITDSIVVDLHVAQIDKDTNGTGEIAVIDGQGQLRVYNQLEGEMEYLLLTSRPVEVERTDTDVPPDRPPGDLPPPRRPRPPMPEGGPPGKGLEFGGGRPRGEP